MLILCDEMALAHAIPMEVVLLQTLAHASALAGHLITSNPAAGVEVPAKFSVLIRTPDAECPAWIGDEISHLIDRQDEMLRAGEKLGSLSALRRQKRVIDAIAIEEGRHRFTGIDRKIELAKRRPYFRFIRRVSRGKLPAASERSYLVALVATGYPALRKLLHRASSHAGSNDTALAQYPNSLGWIASDDWERLTKGTPPSLFQRFGWIAGCGASNFLPELDVAPRLLAPAMLQRLEIARIGGIRYAYRPSDAAKALLIHQNERMRQIVAMVPASIRDRVVPDQFLAWHLTALLVAICGDGRGDDFACLEIQCTRIATAIASWVTASHIHDFRISFPADDDGLITGQDLRVFGFLTDVPCPVRSFQRRLRGVDKDSCLRSLQRLVAAGLAVEYDRDRFAAVPPPDPGHELSDFLSEFDSQRIFPLRGADKSTDITDKNSSSLSGQASQVGHRPRKPKQKTTS
jgi:hypothetical protein